MVNINPLNQCVYSELIYNFVCFLQVIMVVITAHVMVHTMMPLAVLEKDLHLLT
jgi:hypothetical protein